jgi:hypothetical protein
MAISWRVGYRQRKLQNAVADVNFRNFHWRHGERIYRRKSPQLSIEAIARYRDQQFESGLLQRRVSCEPDFFDRRSPKKKSGYRQKSARTRRAYRLVRSEAQSSITSLWAANELADNTIVEL